MSIEVDDREVRAAFARMLAVGENPRAWLGAVGNALVDNTRARFRQSVSPSGVPWHPLSAVTALRRRGGKGGQPLLDTGRFRNSVSMQVEGDSVLVGTNLPFGAMQQFGAKQGQFGRGKYRTRRGSFPIPWGNVPARPWLGVSLQDKADIQAILAAKIGAEK